MLLIGIFCHSNRKQTRTAYVPVSHCNTLWKVSMENVGRDIEPSKVTDWLGAPGIRKIQTLSVKERIGSYLMDGSVVDECGAWCV